MKKPGQEASTAAEKEGSDSERERQEKKEELRRIREAAPQSVSDEADRKGDGSAGATGPGGKS